MTTARLMKMARLVLACNHWGTKHRASITIYNDGDHVIRVHVNVGTNNSKQFNFFSDASMIGTYSDEVFTYDPDFQKAENLIIKYLGELDGDQDV